MNTKALAQLLNSHGKGTEKDGEIHIGAEASLTIYVSLGSETLIIGSVTSVKIMDELLLANTKKKETYAIVSQDVRAVRFGKGESPQRTGLIRD